MSTPIIFPVNNKGGVGKTSVLTDIIAMLSRGYSTGVIDFDLQASLAGTLLRDHGVGNQNLVFYDSLDTVDVLLQKGEQFVFLDTLRKLTIDVQPSKTKLAVFPVGMMYHKAERRKKLEKIITSDFSGVDIIGMDLPPIPDPGLILDHSLKPLVEIINDVHLFPIVVATTEHNTLQIGLEQFKGIREYLLSIGVKNYRISPILMINKVMALWDDNTKIYKGIVMDDLEKLASFGLVREHRSDVVKKYSNEKTHYHVSWLPFFSQLSSVIADGRFSFYFGTKPNVFHFPELYRQVIEQGYLSEKDLNVDSLLFVEQLEELSKFFGAKFQRKKKQFYITNTERKNISDVSSRLVENIKEGERLVFEDWNEHPGMGTYETWQVGEIKVKSWGAKYLHYEFEFPGVVIPIEVMAHAIYESELEIVSRRGDVVGDDRQAVIEQLSEIDDFYKSHQGHSLVHNISFYFQGKGEATKWRVDVGLKNDSQRYMDMNNEFSSDQNFDVFLRNLNDALVANSVSST